MSQGSGSAAVVPETAVVESEVDVPVSVDVEPDEDDPVALVDVDDDDGELDPPSEVVPVLVVPALSPPLVPMEVEAEVTALSSPPVQPVSANASARTG